MMHWSFYFRYGGFFFILSSALTVFAQGQINLNDLPALFELPSVVNDSPAPGRRVNQVSSGWEDTGAHHALYLPNDWEADRKWPIIVEYPGNGGYSNQLGDFSDGTVEGCQMGYGLSQGDGFIWISMPFVTQAGGVSLQWWGDVEKTKRYCIETVRQVCLNFNGDPERVILAGFSRGAIACNYIGLHDDEIAKLWSGMICHSHYDGEFKHPAMDEENWPERLARLGNRPQFISHELSVQPIMDLIQSTSLQVNLTFHTLPFENHSVRWTRCDLSLRNAAVKWLAQFSNSPPDE
ncbi:MAG: hypothetical protein HOM65_07110 [Verrucomicrobia bacterium]|nr:hypothetical protein [Verrucomicrobiota bacterium]MBT5479787.1 hypothetical protein [Verrucomicrobiota bacterium]